MISGGTPMTSETSMTVLSDVKTWDVSSGHSII